MRTINKCWSITTPESAEIGDCASRGDAGEVWSDKVVDEGEEPAHAAAAFLKGEGVTHASSSHAHAGMWYATEAAPSYATGEEREDTYHLKGFTAEEERAIAARLVMSRTVRVHL